MKTRLYVLVGAVLAGACLGMTPRMRADAADPAARANWAEAMTAARGAYLQSPEAATAAASDKLFQPFDSGPLDGNGPAQQVVVNVAGLQELRLVAICERGPANCNIWGEPKLIAQGRRRHPAHRPEADLRQSRLGPVAGGQELAGTSAARRRPAIRVRPLGPRGQRAALRLGRPVRAVRGLRRRGQGPLGGLVRFKVLSAPSPSPAAWADVAREFPMQAGWLRADAGSDGIASWFGPRENAALEQEILGRALRDAAADAPLHAEANALAAAERRCRRRRAGSACTPGPAATAIARRC